MGKHTREYRVWDESEEEALKAGVRKHGLGAWEIIRNDPEFEALVGRTGVQLKDKWRNLIKFRHISLDDKDLFHCKAVATRPERQPRSSGKSSFLQYGTGPAQDSQPAIEGRSITPSDSAANGDRASQKSLFRSSSRRRKSALAADFIMDVDEEDADELPNGIPARSAQRQTIIPGEDRRFGIYDKRRYKSTTGHASGSDVSDSGCLDKDSSELYTVKCPCGATCDDGEQMIECESCQVWAHTACLENLMVEYPSLYSFDFSFYHCPYCQSDETHRSKKRRAIDPSMSEISHSSEQDSRDSLSVFTTERKSGTIDGALRGLVSSGKLNPDSTDVPACTTQHVLVEVPKAAQKCRSKRKVRRKTHSSWCSWLLPEIRPGPINPYRAPLAKPVISPFCALAAQQPSSSSKACNQRLDVGVKREASQQQTQMPENHNRSAFSHMGGSPALQVNTHISKPVECEASPASIKTCDTAEYKVPVSVLCGDVGLRNSMLVLPDDSDDEDGAVSSSHENLSEVPLSTRTDDPQQHSLLGSQSEQELLAAAALELHNERFSVDFVSRAITTPPLNPSLLPSFLDLSLPLLGPSSLPPMPPPTLPHHHAASLLPQHPPLFNLSPIPAALAAAVGKLETEANMLAQLPWMQALFGQPAWPLGLATSAAAAACAAVGISPALELYRQGLAGLAVPQPALKLEPLSLEPTGPRMQPLQTQPDGSFLNTAQTNYNSSSSANKSAVDQAACDAMLLPLLAELRSQTPDPTSFLNAPTPIPEMSLPLPYSGSCPLFDLPPISMLPMSKTPPLPDGLLNMPSLSAPLPGNVFEVGKTRAEDLGTAAFDFLHEFVNPDAGEEHNGIMQAKDVTTRL